MIRMRAQNSDGPLVILGLSAMNITKLQEGMPIHLNLSDIGIDAYLMVFAGDTEEGMLQELKAAGISMPDPKD